MDFPAEMSIKTQQGAAKSRPKAGFWHKIPVTAGCQEFRSLMVRRFCFIALIAVILPCFVGLLHGFVFSFRLPTPQERKVLDKCSKVIEKVLAQFRDDDWEENVDHSLANVEVDPNSEHPLDLNAIIQRTYDVRGSSARYKEQVLPLVKQMVQSQDLDEKKALNQQIQDLMHVQVQVRLNQPHISVVPAPQGASSADTQNPELQNNDLQIPGAAFAYKIKNTEYASGTAYVLLFGDARALTWNPEHNWFDYKFAHPAGTPFVENVEFRIYGADDRIQQLLHTIDWQEINKAITP